MLAKGLSIACTSPLQLEMANRTADAIVQSHPSDIRSLGLRGRAKRLAVEFSARRVFFGNPSNPRLPSPGQP